MPTNKTRPKITNNHAGTQQAQVTLSATGSAIAPVELHYEGYGELAPADRLVVEAATRDILRLQKRRAEDLIAIGRHWLEVKERLDHGQFIEWLEVEFNYRYQAAAEEMNIARRFGSAKYPIIGLLSPTVLRLLAAPSVPDAAVDLAIHFAERNGHSPSVNLTKQYITNERRMAHYDARAQQAQAPDPDPVDLSESAGAAALASVDTFANAFNEAGKAAVRAFFDVGQAIQADIDAMGYGRPQTIDVEQAPATMTIDVEPTAFVVEQEPALSAEDIATLKAMRRALVVPAYNIPLEARGGEYATLVLPSDLIAILAFANIEGALDPYLSVAGRTMLQAAIDLAIAPRASEPPAKPYIH